MSSGSDAPVTASELWSYLLIEIRTLSLFPTLLVLLLLTFVPPLVKPLLTFILTRGTAQSLQLSTNTVSGAKLSLAKSRLSPNADFVALSLAERQLIALEKAHEQHVEKHDEAVKRSSKAGTYLEAVWYVALIALYYGRHLATLSSPLDTGRRGQYLRSVVFPCHSFISSLGGIGAPGIDKFLLPDSEGWRGGGVGVIAVIWAGRKVAGLFVELAGRIIVSTEIKVFKTEKGDDDDEKQKQKQKLKSKKNE